MGEHLTSEQLAQRWGISPGTLANWRGARTGPPFIKLGKFRVLYRLSDIEEYEKKMTVQTRSEK